MGIDGFLRQMREAVDDTHLRQFAGQTLVVDALSWLHKACYGCAFELSTGRETDGYVRYMLRKVDMIRACGVGKVILVFDGQRLPLKASTHEKRQSYKEKNRKRAFQAMAASKQLQGTDRQAELSQAYQHFQRSVSITQNIISTVIDALRAARVPFVVAPFEADAQMVWMCKQGLASGIVTEDSDVVVYCLTANVSSPVLVKLDDNGSAQALSRSILHKGTQNTSNAFLKKIHFLTSGEKEATRMFVQVCVLAGCDFLDSLPNVGLVTAAKHIVNFRGAPGHLRVQRLVSKLSSTGTKVSPDFLEQFVKSEAIFFHHVVFNPTNRSCEFLVGASHANCFPDILKRAQGSLGMSPSTTDLDEVDLISTACHEDLHAAATSTGSFLGQIRARDVVEQIYQGNVCPRTLGKFTEATTVQHIQSLPRLAEQPLQRGQVPSRGKSFAHNVDFSDDLNNTTGGHVSDGERGFRSQVTRRESRVSRPVTPPTTEQIENKQRQHARERASSLRNLMNTYHREETSMSVESANPVKNTPPHRQASTAAPIATAKKRSMINVLGKAGTAITVPASYQRVPPTPTVIKAKLATSSLKELVSKHARSAPPASPLTPAVPKPVLRSAPGPKKRVRDTTTNTSSTSAQKAPRHTKKTTLGRGGKTLLHFFQKSD